MTRTGLCSTSLTRSTTGVATPMKQRFVATSHRFLPSLTPRRQWRMAMRRIRILSAVSALGLGLGAIATAGAAERPVALIIAQGGLGDQSYNDLAYSGFKKALADDKLEGKAVESKDVVAQAADILRRASDAGFGLIVDLEYSHGDALLAVAKDYAGTDYVILSQVRPGASVA